MQPCQPAIVVGDRLSSIPGTERRRAETRATRAVVQSACGFGDAFARHHRVSAGREHHRAPLQLVQDRPRIAVLHCFDEPQRKT